MFKYGNSSAEYKIDWVRVYQDPTDTKQKVGCSTPERPTKKWIESHQDLYKDKDDVSCFDFFGEMMVGG